MKLKETKKSGPDMGIMRCLSSDSIEDLRHPSVESCTGRPLLMHAEGLCKAFGGQSVLNGVGFDLWEGQVVLLRGANGSGKTTLLNMLTGHIEPDAGTMELKTNGSVEHFRFPRRWWQDLNPCDHFLPERVAREGVGRSWQDTRLFSTLNLRDNIVVSGPEDRHGHSPARILLAPKQARRIDLDSEDKASGLLDELGLGDRGQSSADKVSLGQTKRVAIARAVHAGAKILFLDEPLSGLDAPGVRSVLDLLKSLVDSHRLTLVIVEHVWNARHILPLADTLWTLDQGKLTQESNCSSTHNAADCPKHDGSGDIASLFPEYSLTQSIPLPRGAVLDIYRKHDADAGETILDVRNLVVFRGKRLVIGTKDKQAGDGVGLCFTIREGDLAVLRAANGWGKTTLLDALGGVHPFARGKVLFRNRDLAPLRPWQRYKAGLQYIRADSSAFPSLSLAQVSQLMGHQVGSHAYHATRLYGSMSGGEKRVIQMELMESVRPGVALLDEPYSALDEKNLQKLAACLGTSLGKGDVALLIALPATVASSQKIGASHTVESEVTSRSIT